MRSRVAWSSLSLAVLALAAGPAHADVDRRGYLLSRFQLLPTDTRAVLYPMLEVEEYQAFLEANLDLAVKGDRYTVRADTSALFRAAPSGCREGSKLPGCFVINELYGSYDVIADRVAVLVGRHRTSWGSAMTFHPVEAMNPQPDPTDPSFQRLGAWTALVELTTERYVATTGWFPRVTHAAIGVPSGGGAGLVGGRFAWRPSGFDVSAIGYFDLEEALPLVGASGSATLGDSPFEVHAEALVHQRREIKTGTLREGTCPIRSLGIPHRKELDVSGIAGGRWDKGDGTLVNVEYLHNADGMVGNDFRAVLATADLLTDMCPDGRLEANDAAEDGRPQQFSSTFLRRNYAIVSALKPTFGDDGLLSRLGASGSLLVGIDDPSGVATARLIYTIADATIVRVGGLVRAGGDRSQYGVLPFHGTLLMDVQALF